MELALKLTITYLVLLLVSIAYNALTAWAERNGIDGYVSLLVVGGVAYTLIAVVWLIGWKNTCILAGAFMASGFPMVLGSITRHIAQRRREEKALSEHARRMAGK